MIRIHDKEFKSKRRAEQYIRFIRDRSAPCVPIQGDYFNFMRALIDMHPSHEQKVGCGIATIYTKINPDYPSTVCFWIQRTDGSSTDFSFKECLTPTSDKKRFFNACRVAVEPITMRFKEWFFKHCHDEFLAPTCPITYTAINKNNSHVDHYGPAKFKDIVDAFIRAYDININDIVIDGKSVDNVCQDTFADKQFENMWIKFHNELANLRVVSKKANLSILRKNK